MDIHYPYEKKSEFEIQAELYLALKDAGFDVRGEVSAYKSRLDLVVFVDEEPLCIIETKSWKKKVEPTRLKQVKKYEKYFDVPVFICGRDFKIPEIVGKVQDLTDAVLPF